MLCDPTAPSPRIYTYDVTSMMGLPTKWRYTRVLANWMAASRYHEPNGDCVDYFFVPSHPPGGDDGDVAVARLFNFVRSRWPYWNQTVERGVARHFWIIPGDHAVADSAYSRPAVPNKYAEDPAAGWHPRRSHGRGLGPLTNGADLARQEFLRATWGQAWEGLNPASPARLLFFLTYSGWADGLRHPRGACLNCFQPGLDIRLPQPDVHLCGPFCGLRPPEGGGHPPRPVARLLLARNAVRGNGQRQLASGDARNCTFFFGGADRFGRNAARRAVVTSLRNASGACVFNTLADPAPPLPRMLASSRFCFSPRGWDNGDSDRYLPLLLYGCVPVLSDRLEALPLSEHPQMEWNETALFIENGDIPRLMELLGALPDGAHARMAKRARGMWQRLLHTSAAYASSHQLCAPCTRGGGGAGPAPSLAEREERCRRALPRATARVLEQELDSWGLAERAHEACARDTSYLGESGQDDAYHTLMQVLQARLAAPPTPPEPWQPRQLSGPRCSAERERHRAARSVASVNALNRCHKLEQSTHTGEEAAVGPAATMFFHRCAVWYNTQLERGRPLTSVDVAPPAQLHRDALRRTMQ